MKDEFLVDYLLEAEEDQFEPTPETPEEETNDQFSVDTYDVGDDSTPEEEETTTEEEPITDVDVNEIYSTIAEFFESQDAEKVKEWIQNVVDTKHVVSTESFLDDFDTAEDMEESFNDFVAGEEHEESETPEEEKEEHENGEESEETNEKEEPMTESRKTRRVVKESLDNLESTIYDYVENQIAEMFGEPVSEVQDLVYRETKYTVEELDDEIHRIIRNAKESGKYNNRMTESRKTRRVVNEMYSEDLSQEIQSLITLKQEQSDPGYIKSLDAAIEALKEKLKAPAQQIVKPQTPVQESIRDRIRKRLAKK